MFLRSRHRGKKQNLIPSASTPMLSVSSRGIRPRTTWPRLQDQGTHYSRTPPLSCLPMVRRFPIARQAGESTLPSLAPPRLKRFGNRLSRPPPAPPGLVPCSPTAAQGSLALSNTPSLDPQEVEICTPGRPPVLQSSLRQRLLCKALCHPSVYQILDTLVTDKVFLKCR